MQSTIGIEIDAPPELVFALAGDVTRWRLLLPHYSRSRADRVNDDGSLTCSFVARRPLPGLLGLGLPVTWRSRVRSDASTLRLHFHHTGGVTKGMDVTWRLAPRPGGGTRVDIDHRFERGPGDVLPRFVERFFIRAIAGRTLATFKATAEAVAAVGFGL